MLIIHTADDDVVHPDVAVYNHKNIPTSRLVQVPKGGHFVFYHDFIFIEYVLNSLWSQRETA